MKFLDGRGGVKRNLPVPAPGFGRERSGALAQERKQFLPFSEVGM